MSTRQPETDQAHLERSGHQADWRDRSNGRRYCSTCAEARKRAKREREAIASQDARGLRAKRHLLAWSCSGCGVLLTRGGRPSRTPGAQCQPCWRRGMMARNPEVIRRSARAAYARAQAESLETADRRWAEWTSAELDLVIREGHTNREIAALTGRTLAAVRQQRKVARRGLLPTVRTDQ